MKKLFACIGWMCVCLMASAQIKDQPAASDLQLKWKLNENGYQGKNAYLSTLTITNKGKIPLRPQGWKLYFSCAREIDRVVSGAVVSTFMNGDLQCFSPANGFPVLAPGASYVVQYSSIGRSFSFSDAPNAFYMVWEQAPEKGHPITNVSTDPVPDAGTPYTGSTSEQMYRKNAAVPDIPLDSLPKIFPVPVSYKETGGFFNTDINMMVEGDAFFLEEKNLLVSEWEKITGKSNRKKRNTSGKIVFEKVAGLQDEAYQLEITPSLITIKSGSKSGAFYAIQSLKTMVVPGSSDSRIPCVKVEDAPRFGYRSFMLDVARDFQSKQEVLRILDLIALYKLNTLHFHLIDDEGWRLEIPGLPELTEVGGTRGHSNVPHKMLQPSFGSDPDPKDAYGTGFYSKTDFIEILRYARERHIRVIPEIETPGHARASIQAMDARYHQLLLQNKKQEAIQYLLRDTADASEYRSVQGWNDNVINVALPSTYVFLEKVVDEIKEMYREANAPLQTIHMGGDEVPNGVWQKSPAVQELMRKNGIHKTDDLWYYYFGKVNAMLQSKGLYLSGWEEIAMRKTTRDGAVTYIPNPGFVQENFHAYVWNNVWGWGAEDLAYRLANAGYKVILAPVTNLYFDLAYTKNIDEPGLYWGGYTDIDKPFRFAPNDYYKTATENVRAEPLDKSIFIGKDRLTEYGKSNIVGIQCLIWSEKIRGGQQLEYMLLPKLLGFAERAWGKEPAWETEKDSIYSETLYHKDWSRFVNTVGKRELPRLSQYNGGYNYRIPPPGVSVSGAGISANVQFPGLVIRYTTDGTEPTEKSSIYTGPLKPANTVKLKVFSGNKSGRSTGVISK